MPRIELELSDEVYAKWRAFLRTEPAGRLIEAGWLGDWTALGFMAEVHRYLEQGAPGPKPTEEEQRDLDAVLDRRSLTKPQRRVLPMFNENDSVTLAEMARLLCQDPGVTAGLVAGWLAQGFMAQGPERDGEAAFVLGPKWRKHNLAANRPSLNAPRAPFMQGLRAKK
jgi:hypothetical protein